MAEKLRVGTPIDAFITILFGLVGAGIIALVHAIPMPYTMVSLLKFGLAPSLTIIAFVGAIRGPLAGLVAGYLGIISHDLFVYGEVVGMTLPAMAYGILGLIVGLASYDFSNGRSLGKLSGISAIGLIFTGVLLAIIGIFVEQNAILVVLGFVMLPLLTTGLPSVILITPILARLWLTTTQRIQLPLS
ncbi:MAG: hypothetical protein ACFFF9_11415 [Candidatus Thorarchaeota archaeon]